jgi:hypothetical protein
MVFVCVVFVFNHDLFPVSGSVWTVQVDCRRTRIGSDVGSCGVYAGDVLPDHPSGPFAANKSKKFDGEVATIIAQSCSETGD